MSKQDLITLSAIKADVGSPGGHTKPSQTMLDVAKSRLAAQVGKTIIDFDVTHTGDDICLLMTHHHGNGAEKIHNLSWDIFLAATEVAEKEGLYAAGQDLLVDAPSGNVRGAGPGAAEITFNPSAKERPAESFSVITGDKCGPGAFNFPLWATFCSPYFNTGLMLPYMGNNFVFTIIDMEHSGGDRILKLNSERHIDLNRLLLNENRYGVLAIHSLQYPRQQVASLSTDRLHTIAGVYKGKDDPVLLLRNQGIFPAPEELTAPFRIAPFVAGDARGSHHMAWMPVAINTAVTGFYCIPLVSCVGYSVNGEGKLSESIDFFGNPAWDAVRLEAQRKGGDMRSQGGFGPAMLSKDELEYTPLADAIGALDEQFEVIVN